MIGENPYYHRGPIKQAAGGEFSKSTEDLILNLAGPHPFFLQIACFHPFELSREDPSFGEHSVRQLKKNVYEDSRCHFEYFVRRLSEGERCALARLLDTAQTETSTAALKELEQKCLIRRRDGGYVLFVFVNRKSTHLTIEK